MARGPPTATALLLLHEAAQAFRGLVPQLGGNQAAIATQLLNAVDHALTGAEQTLEVGDSQETVPALQCEPSEVVGDTVNAQTEPDTIQPVQHTVEATATNAQQAGEPTDFSLGSDMPGTETEDEAFWPGPQAQNASEPRGPATDDLDRIGGDHPIPSGALHHGEPGSRCEGLGGADPRHSS